MCLLGGKVNVGGDTGELVEVLLDPSGASRAGHPLNFQLEKIVLRHRGKSGYFFWPTVRKNKENIAKVYLDAIDKVLEGLKDR